MKGDAVWLAFCVLCPSTDPCVALGRSQWVSSYYLLYYVSCVLTLHSNNLYDGASHFSQFHVNVSKININGHYTRTEILTKYIKVTLVVCMTTYDLKGLEMVLNKR